ncbi:MAG: Asp-tRNA(Asn)/Glu-tRNA(Gln) amidotransferase subunit GatB [Acidobacteriota bacterium]
MFEPVIGLEIHAQLLTRSKLFCGCAATFGAAPNSRTCPVCLGLPGALPVLNGAAVDLAITAALALGCTLHPVSVFARKNYFYPDLPKGYQITQYDRPLATGGEVRWTSAGRDVRVAIDRLHLEEDAGKSLHDVGEGADTFVDFNRSGVPLVEIVTGPDLRTPADAADFFRRLRALLVAVGASDGCMEEGSLRCDANVSVRRVGDTAFGEKVEVKNLNSFRWLERALEYEVTRQTETLLAGQRIRADTRLWDERTGRTATMRAKEEAHDYRYFAEPDLPPLHILPSRIAQLRQVLPDLPEAIAARLVADHGLDEDVARRLADDAGLRWVFEAAAAEVGDSRQAANWVTGELVRRMKETGLDAGSLPFGGRDVGRLLRMVDAGRLSATAAKRVLARMLAEGASPEEVVEAEGLSQDSSVEGLQSLVAETLSAHPGPVSQFRAGKAAVLGFLIGKAMKASGGRANPALVDELVRAWLAGPDGR